jgi:hypothetical protein
VCGKLTQQTVTTPWIKYGNKKSFCLCVEIGILLLLESVVIVRNTFERTETCEIYLKFILYHSQIRYFSCLIIPFLLNTSEGPEVLFYSVD